MLFATEKLLVNAEGDVRAQVENAVRQAGYTLRDADAPAAEQTRGSLLRDNLPLLTLVIMMALSWGWSRANPPCRSVGLYRHHPGWPCGRLPARRYA
ncbi:hypothetical protein LNP74_10785 [Klebsiella pneumoniae subsp. pneumoniae]|nr:hypothetical protein [Klebsiella pneumoniae subsp. pneumoniae]